MIPLLLDAMEKPSTLAIATHDESKPLIDSLPGSALTNTKALSQVGLADAFSWARLPSELSDGQAARFMIASQMASPGQVVVVDNFCNGLDRVTARAVAWTFQKAARRAGKTVVALTPHTDLVESFRPDLRIETNWRAEPTITWEKEWPGTSQIIAELTYERGTIKDWHDLSPLHYSAGDPATTHSYHVLRHPDISHPAAVAVLSYPDLHSAARNLATDDAYRIGGSRQQAMKVNREVLKLSRLITCPELRCIGLTHHLIDQIIPQLNCKYIECATAMGRYSNFLTKIGFTEVPQTAHPTEAKLAEFIDVNHIDQRCLIDPVAFAAVADKLSVRKAREIRRIVWHFYHHFVLHRRTRKPQNKTIPPPSDPRWNEAWDIAAKRALERPAFFILGPLENTKWHQPTQPASPEPRTSEYNLKDALSTVNRMPLSSSSKPRNDLSGQLEKSQTILTNGGLETECSMSPSLTKRETPYILNRNDRQGSD